MMWISIFLAMQLASAAIFGVDDRISIDKNQSNYLQFQSTAVGVLNSLGTSNANGTITLENSHSQEFLCKEERFSAENYLPYACSGFLLAPNVLVTAGHCGVNSGEVKNDKGGYCEVYSWWFGFDQKYRFPTDKLEVPQDSFYRCKQIIYAVKDDTTPFKDFAIVELDRPVTQGKPLKIGSSKNITDKLSMIGYPLGQSAKLSKNAKVLWNDLSRESFITNLDAFEGNSGSAVFNSKNEVVGILVGGTPISSTIQKKGCEIFNRCDENANTCLERDEASEKSLPGFQRLGSEVQRIESVVDFLQKYR